MEIYIRDQLTAFLYAIVVGAALGALYDVFRVGRMVLGLRPGGAETPHVRLPLVGDVVRDGKHGGFFAAAAVFVGDILFFAIATAVYLVFVFHASSGYNRWFLTVGAIGGFAAYFFTLGKLVMRVSGVIRFVLLTMAAYIRFLLLFPLRMAVKYLLRPTVFKISSKIAQKRTKKAKKALAKSLVFVYNINNYNYIL